MAGSQDQVLVARARDAGIELKHDTETKGRSLWLDAWRRLRTNKAAMISIAILILLTVAVIAGPWLSPYRFDQLDWQRMWAPPSLSNGHWFGTDSLGRDLLVRTLYGGRISLLVGVISTAVSVVIGVAYGATAGYFGGHLDAVMMRVVDILYAMPFLFFVILLMVFFDRHIVLMFVAIGAVNWLDIARVVRGQTLSLKQAPFIEAARLAGAGGVEIIRRHIVPNLLGVVVIYVTLAIPQVILVESFLSFLGLGVQAPATSWGALVNEGAQEMETAPWLLIFPASFLAITLFCFNFIGDGLRYALDPRDR
ncbi:MAG TPA: ABC transporter permease subunit [Gammaproteobacteria bacterium]|nr:ABC transporter permease subunit [Gammaproteobacteria bacterium]